MKPLCPRRRSAGVLWGAVLPVFLVLCWTGCAGPARPAPNGLPAAWVQEDAAEANRGWWRGRIRFAWPPDRPPRWHLDLLAADRLIRPVLLRHRNEIALWRFHRRAARDESGHQLSFLFYADRATARNIFAEMGEDPLLASLHSAGMVDAFLFDDPDGAPEGDVGATSDPVWSGELRSAWPYYIMGASTLWLELIHQAAGGGPPPEQTAEALAAYYRNLENRVSDIWRDEAQHALLHHLNALFGYRPLIIRKPMRF